MVLEWARKAPSRSGADRRRAFRHELQPMRSEKLHVRGKIPKALEGSLIVACSRRIKDRTQFSRWHDSQTDLIRIDLTPGSPGRAVAEVFTVDPSGSDLGESLGQRRRQRVPLESDPRYGYLTQPNHGINVSGETVWVTNLLFGCPLELDLRKWRPRRVLRYVEPVDDAPRITGTAHFAWSLDGRYTYFEQSLLHDAVKGDTVRSGELRLVRFDTKRKAERIWKLRPPPDDASLAEANFHSAFYFEEGGRAYVGLLRTGAVVESLAPHATVTDHAVVPSTASTIWVVPIDEESDTLAASTLPGIRELDGISLSHLDIDNAGGDGFVLYANYKEADVAEETHGVNVYGEQPEQVVEHYSGMTVEALNVGQVIRVERRRSEVTIKRFKRAYDAGRTSLGHTWLPINIQLDASRENLFCSFAGFRPRLLPRHIASAYPKRAIDPRNIRYVPPLLMRFDAKSLEPAYSKRPDYLAYGEPIAMCVVGDCESGYVCTFSPELGVRIYRAGDLSAMEAHVTAHPLWHVNDSHFRPTPPHVVFVPN